MCNDKEVEFGDSKETEHIVNNLPVLVEATSAFFRQMLSPNVD